MIPEKRPILKRADFLSNSKTAKKFNIPVEVATKVMKSLYFKKATIKIKTSDTTAATKQANAVTQNIRLHRPDEYLLHPMAIELFAQELAKQKGKQ